MPATSVPTQTNRGHGHAPCMIKFDLIGVFWRRLSKIAGSLGKPSAPEDRKCFLSLFVDWLPALFAHAVEYPKLRACIHKEGRRFSRVGEPVRILLYSLILEKRIMTASLKYAAGIDVGAETVSLVIRKLGTAMKAQQSGNTPIDRAKLVKQLGKFPDIVVCLEATGVYSLDLAIALHDAGIRVMVLNPKAAHNFAKVLLRSAKTDDVDADTLAQYAERMPFQAWARPSNEALGLRALSRRINALTRQKAAAKNQLHAAAFSPDAQRYVCQDIELAISQLEQRIVDLTAAARAFIMQHPELQQRFALLLSVKGIAETSAIALLGELVLLPAGLTHKEWVKYAGLDPRPFQSGKSVNKPSRLSKAGNRYIRQALYMPALSAKTHDPHVRAYAEHLLQQGKLPMQTVCAVMRKLLHAIHGMFKFNQPFDNTRFYAITA